MKKVLFVATVVRLHINMFHTPFLRWFHEQGWQVDVAANNDYENKSDCVIPYCDHFHCINFQRNPLRSGNVQAYRQLKELLDREHYDIIHCHTPMGSVLTRLLAENTRKRGTKVIYTAHGFHFFRGAPLVNWLFYYPVEKMLADRMDLLITINDEDYTRAQTLGAKRVARVNGVGIDLSRFGEATPEVRQEVRKELGLREDDIFTISVSRLDNGKKHNVLIEAIAKLNNPKVHLFICGDGKLEGKLKALAKKLGVQEQIHFLGFRKDISRLCGSADLFLFASLREGLPVAVMEAMACGLPIVASNIRGNVDLIEEGKGGYLVDPTDVDGFVSCIQNALSNPRKLEEMKKHNLVRIQGYSTETVIAQLAELYHSLEQTDAEAVK